MAGEISTLELKVELDCHLCYKKMRKALCKFPEIKRQNFDEEQKKVIISGLFEPEKLIKKLYCKVGCKIIKGYVIIVDPPKPSTPPKSPEREPPHETPSKTKTPSTPPMTDKQSKPEPVAPGPVNIMIGPIGPVCSCRPFRSRPDYSIPLVCNCRLRIPTCHCNGNCQCRPYYYPTCQSNSYGSQGNCQCGCGGHYESGCRFLIKEDQSECMIM